MHNFATELRKPLSKDFVFIKLYQKDFWEMESFLNQEVSKV